jgi:FkbM family methyltransferase
VRYAAVRYQQVPLWDRMRSIVRYRRTVRGQWYTVRAAANASERMSLVKFIFTQYLAFFGLVKPRDRRVRFRGNIYVFGQTAEFLVLCEFYRDRDYGRNEAFLPRVGSNVIDVGANVGLFTIYHAAAGARVLAIEPNEGPYRRLIAAVEANHFGDRVTIIHAAIGARRGRSRIVAPPGMTVVGRAVPVEVEAPIEDDHVDVLPLDEVVSAHHVATIDLLKIDVESAEMEVLRGANVTLARTRRVVLEYHSEGLLAETRRLLTGAGFSEIRRHDILPGVGMLYMARVD